jgi:hypothetical protein
MTHNNCELTKLTTFLVVRWLVARGRNTEARALIQRAAKRNCVTIPDQLIHDMEKTIQLELTEETIDKNYTAIDLFRLFATLKCKMLDSLQL